MGKGLQVNSENRASIIFQLAKGDTERALKLSKMTNEELSKQLSNPDAENSEQNGIKLDNSFWSNLINSFGTNPKTNSGPTIFQFNSQQANNNFYPSGLTIEKTQPQNCSQNESASNVQAAKESANVNNTSKKTEQEPTDASAPKPAPATYEESKEYTIDAIHKNVINAVEAFLKQKKTEGGISRTYNSFKELFDSELSGTNTYRVLMADMLGSELMERANKGELSKKEYWEAKIDLVMQLIPDKDKMSDEDKNKISNRLHGKTIQEINLLIENLKYAKDNGEAKTILKKEYAKGLSLEDRGKNGPTQIGPNYSEEKMTFEEVYRLERGVEFNPKNIEDFEKKSAQYELVSNVSNMKDAVHKSLDESLSAVEHSDQSGKTWEEKQAAGKKLQEGLIASLKTLYGNDEAKINEELKKLYGNDSISYKNGAISYKKPTTSTGLINIPPGRGNDTEYQDLIEMSKKLLSKVDENTKKVMGNKTLKDYEQEYGNSYALAYGQRNATQLAQAFAHDQEAAVGKAKTAVSIGGGVIAIGGMLIPGPGWVGTASMITGMLSSTVGVAAVDVANETTRPQGMSDEKWAEIKKELKQNTMLMAAGFAAGSAGNMAKEAVLAGQAANAATKIAAIAAQIGTDATISLISQMAITGEINLEGEGIGQMISQVMGILAARKAAKMNTSLQDLNPKMNPTFSSAVRNLKMADAELYEDFKLLRNKNMLPSNVTEIFYSPNKANFNKNLLEDIKKMAEAVRNGVEPIDAFVPKLNTLNEAANNKKIGEVFSLKNTNDVYVMDKNGPVKLDMDRDAFFKMFPPLESHATSQGQMGDCWFVSGGLDAFMSNPNARAKFYQMFSQKGNDIIIKFPPYKDAYLDDIPTEIVFKNGKLHSPGLNGSKVSGASAMQLFEQAYGYRKAAESMAYAINDYPADLKQKIYKELQEVLSGSDAKLSPEFKKAVQKAYGIQPKLFETRSEVGNFIRSKIFGWNGLKSDAIGKGGMSEDLWRDLFPDNEADISIRPFWENNPQSKQDALNFMEKVSNSDEYIIQADTKSDVKSLMKKFQSPHDGIADKHAYRIDSIDMENKIIRIVNPWNTSQVVDLSFDEFFKYFENIKAMKVPEQTVKPELPSDLKSTLTDHGIKYETTSGRKLDYNEAINKLNEQIIKEKHLNKDKFMAKNGDEAINPAIKELPAYKDFCKKLEELGLASDYYAQYLLRWSETDMSVVSSRITKLKEIFTKNSNSSSELFGLMHEPTNLDFILKNYDTIYNGMKHKNPQLTDEQILATIKVINKDNYNEFKFLWE